MERAPTRVLLVDDHAVVRSGLRFFLENVADIEVVGEASDGEQAYEMTAEIAPDVVLMDVKMPQVDGITATRRIRECFPAVRVLALTSFVEGELVQRALNAGAIGYMLKDSTGADLVSAIRMAHTGKPVLSSGATQALVKSMSAPPRPGGDLSEREHTVLHLMTRGLNNDQIAHNLCISRNTVRHHVHNILTKLGVASRTEAVSLAFQHSLAV